MNYIAQTNVKINIMDQENNNKKVTEQFVIDFADWKDYNCFKAKGIMLWYINMDEEIHGVYNNKQLLEIYKKTYEGTK